MKSLLAYAFSAVLVFACAASQFNLTLENDCFLPDKSLNYRDYKTSLIAGQIVC